MEDKNKVAIGPIQTVDNHDAACDYKGSQRLDEKAIEFALKATGAAGLAAIKINQSQQPDHQFHIPEDTLLRGALGAVGATVVEAVAGASINPPQLPTNTSPTDGKIVIGSMKTACR